MRWKGCAFGLEGSSEIFGVFERGSIKLRENSCRAAIADEKIFGRSRRWFFGAK